jgi:hypothetical protein
MNQQQLTRAWHEIAVEGVSADLNLWPRIQARLDAAPMRPRLHWSTALALALVAALVLGATSYAALPTVRRLLLLDAQLSTADPAALGQPLDLRQTIGGVTVAVEWLHVEPERVLVGYTVTSADGQRFDAGIPTLTPRGGAELEYVGGYGVVGQSDLLGVDLPPGESSQIAVFTRRAGEAGPLSLTLYAAAVTLPAATDAAPSAPGEVILATPPGPRLGPFVFELALP